MELLFQAKQFVHQLRINMETTGGIENNDIVAVVLGVGNCLFGNFNGVNLTHFKNRNVNLASDDLELVDCRRTVNVAGDEKRASPLFLKMEGELSGMGGFTGALETDHHNDGGDFRREIYPGVGFAHKSG